MYKLYFKHTLAVSYIQPHWTQYVTCMTWVNVFLFLPSFCDHFLFCLLCFLNRFVFLLKLWPCTATHRRLYHVCLFPWLCLHFPSSPCLSRQSIFLNRPLRPVITPFCLPFVHLAPSVFPLLLRCVLRALISLPFHSPLRLCLVPHPCFFLQDPPSPSFFSSNFPQIQLRLFPSSLSLSPHYPPTPASLWPFPRRLGAEGAGWRGDGWPLRQLIGNSLIYGQALPRPNGFISFCRHMMSQPRSPQQRPPFVVVSLADDLRGMAGWREREREWWRRGQKGGCEVCLRKRGRDVWACVGEAVSVCRKYRFCLVWKRCFYCFSFTLFPKVSFPLIQPRSHFLCFYPLLSESSPAPEMAHDKKHARIHAASQPPSDGYYSLLL